MQMVHGKEPPNYGGNNGASGSHGGERYHAESNHRTHTEGQSLFGGANNRVPGSSRVTPRPYMPSFLDAQQHDAHFQGHMEVEDNFEEYEREYATLSAGFRRQVTLSKYCGIKYRGRPREFHRGNNDLGHKAGKMEIPPFDGTTKSSTKAWVQKLDAYLQLNPMMELDAIKFATLYLEGKAHEWWYHGMTTLGHAHITSYTEFHTETHG
jgi:hypothetical protein